MTATAPTRPLRQDAQRNRDRIVDAARAAFAADGIEVGVEQIAKLAGVGVGTVYRRFPTKEALVDAVVAEQYEEFARVAREALERAEPWEGLREFLERSMALQASNRAFKEAAGARVASGELAAARARVTALVRLLVERAQASGDLRPDLAVEDVAVLFWSSGRVIELTADVAPTLWRRHLGLVLDGLRASAATPLPAAPLTPSQVRAALARSGRAQDPPRG